MRQTLSLKETGIVLGLVLLLGCLGGFFGWYVGYYRIPIPFLTAKSEKNIQDIQYALSLVSEKYDGTVNIAKAIDGAIAGVLDSLGDQYSFYIPPDQVVRLKEQDQGHFIGIGIIYTLDGKTPVLSTVIPNSPAEKAGLLPGMRIVTIDDTDVSELENPIAIQLALRGPEGKDVMLSVTSKDGSSRTVTITRKQFTVPSLSLSVLPNGIGHLKVYQFPPNFREEFTSVATQLKTQSINKLIVDLRGNTGGTAEMGTFLADQFIKEGILVREKLKSDVKETVRKAAAGDPLEELPLVVIVNKSTGSEAEVFVAAIADHQRGKIVGETTYGKGTQQDTIPFSDGSAIQITVGKWLTPEGNWVQGKGITPDISVEESVTTTGDAILERGLNSF